MNVVVTNNHIDYTGFLKVGTLQEADSLVGDIEVLVYHKSNESQEMKNSSLSHLKDRVSKLIYISGESTVNKEVQMIVVGSGGKYFDDEFFLESSAELSRLISNLDGVVAMAEMSGLNVVTDFLNRYLSNGSSSFQKPYLAVVNEALSSIVKDYKQKSLELVQVSETATDLFSRSIDLVENINKERENLKEVVKTLQTVKDSGQLEPTRSIPSMPSLLFFPPVSYLKERDIIRIKEIGNFTHLVSFMMGFRIYLERLKYVKPRLIFLMPVGALYEKMYGEYEWVTAQSSKTMGVYSSNIIFTNFPNKDVLYRLLDDSDFDTFIVVDMLKSDSKHLLNCKGYEPFYAISGSSVLTSCGIKAMSSFSSNSLVKGTLFTLETFEDYPLEVSQRERKYLADCSSMYEILYKIRRK